MPVLAVRACGIVWARSGSRMAISGVMLKSASGYLIPLASVSYTHLSAVLTAAGMLVLLLWNRKPLRFCLPLLLALVLLLGLKGFSPMEQRQMRSLDSNELYREKTEAVMGSDMGYAYRKGEEMCIRVRW